MGILDFFKKRDEVGLEQEVNYGRMAIDSFFGSSSSVTEEEAMQIPAIAASIDLISGAIAQMDFYLVKKDKESGESIRKVNDPRLVLLNREPNDEMDAYTYKKAMVRDFIFHGTSNSVIERTLNDVTALYLLPTEKLSVQLFLENGYKRYSETTLQNSKGNFKFLNHQLLTVLRNSKDGFIGQGILAQNEKTLRMAIDESKYSSSILKNGSLPLAILKSDKKLSAPAFANLKSSWSDLYQGVDKAGKTVILEEGLDYKPISMNPNDMQLTESKRTTLSEIARILNMPESMINSSASKYGSNERDNIAFLQYCISPIVKSIEGAVNKSLLLEKEKEDGYEFKIDSSKLLRMTRKERAEAISQEFNGGLISFWEARGELDRADKTREDYFKMTLGTVMYKYEDDELVIPNTMQSGAVVAAQSKT